VECFLSDDVNVWFFGGFYCSVVLLLILLVGVQRRRRGRGDIAGQGAGGGCNPLGEVLIFLALLYGRVYVFPAMALDYVAATANGRNSAAPLSVIHHLRYEDWFDIFTSSSFGIQSEGQCILLSFLILHSP
jgi:hypothetical protein